MAQPLTPEQEALLAQQLGVSLDEFRAMQARDAAGKAAGETYQAAAPDPAQVAAYNKAHMDALAAGKPLPGVYAPGLIDSAEDVQRTSAALNGGKTLGYAATGAAAGSAFGPIGAGVGALGGAVLSLIGDDDDNNKAPQAPAAQFAGGNGSALTNQLAALQYSQGLQQQQAQDAREAAFYNQANGNFDIGNAAQSRDAAQIQANTADQQRQLAALGATNAGIGNLNSTGNLLTGMGTAPQGPSYAEAQLRLGQSDAMNQQLAMARSGRSLGSGQAAMSQAAFNNAMINQTTNQQAAAARLQEQQNYNQFQLAALQGAGNAYTGAGGLAGQAGNQATTIRSGNEGLQAQNAALSQSQQQINNQTTGLYNQLGAQQQQLGMQANTQGQNAYQFGQQQGQNMQVAQLNANLGQTSSIAATNIANQNNANAHDAATMNMVSSGMGYVADKLGNANSAPTTSAGSPSGPASNGSPQAVGSAPSGSSIGGPEAPAQSSSAPLTTPYSQGNDQNARSSDERQKTNIKALGGKVTGDSALDTGALLVPGTRAAADKAAGDDAAKYGAFSDADAAAYRKADAAARNGTAPIGPLMDTDTNKIPVVEGPTQSPVASYAETIAALNNAYRPSQFAPVDVLNHVPGAGAGHSASQDAVIARMQGRQYQPPTIDPNSRVSAVVKGSPSLYENTYSGSQLSNLGRGITGAQSATAAAAPSAAPAAPPAAAWGDVFNAPQLDPRVQAYLSGMQYSPPAAPAPTPTGAPQYQDTGGGYIGDSHYDLNRLAGQRSSDAHSKTKIRQLETQLAALSADSPPTASFAPTQPDYGALDQAYAREQNAPAVDLRPAQGYSYEYKDPRAPGAAPGRHIGPMAQDLERTAAANTVRDTPHGKVVDTPGLTMVNTAAISEQQRKTQELERQLAALSGSGLGPMPAYNQSLYAQPGTSLEAQLAALQPPTQPAYRANIYPQIRSPY